MKIKTDIAKLLEEALDKYNSMVYNTEFFMSEYWHTMYEWLSKFLADDESFMLSNSELVNWFTLMIIEELSVDITDLVIEWQDKALSEYENGHWRGHDEGYYNGYADAKMIYGWKAADANKIFDQDILTDLIDDGILEYTSPFYDSGYDRGYIGVDASIFQGVTNGNYIHEILNNLDIELREILSEHFRASEFEITPALYFGPHVT